MLHFPATALWRAVGARSCVSSTLAATISYWREFL